MTGDSQSVPGPQLRAGGGSTVKPTMCQGVIFEIEGGKGHVGSVRQNASARAGAARAEMTPVSTEPYQWMFKAEPRW
jgi:hypothetical protein